MWRATLAGSAGIQITRRTARTIWEHRPRRVSRDDVEPAKFTKGSSITSREGRMSRANLRVPRAHGGAPTLRIRGSRSGGWGRTRKSAARRPGRAGQSGSQVNASSIPDARWGRGRWSAHTALADRTRPRAMPHGLGKRAGVEAGARVHRPQGPCGWNG